MGASLHAFARNLRAGLRLAFFLPVDRLAFRIDLTQLLLLFALSALIDIGGDWFRVAPPRELSLLGAGSELYAAGLLLLAAALIAIFNRQSPLALALPVIVLAALPVVQALHYLPFVAVPELRRGSRRARVRVRDHLLDHHPADPLGRGRVLAAAVLRVAARDRRRPAARLADLVRQRTLPERAVVAGRRRTRRRAKPA